MSTVSRIIFFMILCSLLNSLTSGCSLFVRKGTIGQLQKIEKEQTDFSFDNVDHKKVREEYQELIDLVDDDYLKEQIKRRVAEVYMLEGDENQTKLSVKPNQSYYGEAIQSYSDILEKYPNSPDNAEVLYQLAKAYDMEGQQDDALLMLQQLTSRHPRYEHVAEAYFRMGDIYFNNNKYSRANKAYTAVTRYNIRKLNINAHYMLGWSQYKQGDYDQSLRSFSFALAELMGKSQAEGGLNKVDKPLIKDTLHSMTLALVNTGGAKKIKDLEQLDRADYSWMVYEDLGDFYLEKERYEDSAITYRQFVTRHTASPMAHKIHSKLISAYIKGGFPHQALPEKERFVEYYGLHSQYNAKQKGQNGIREEVKADLKKYIEELAKHYHHAGQKEQKTLQTINIKKEAKQYRKAEGEAIILFSKAAEFYQEYVDTFPQDESIAQITYLKAETRYSARQYALAITDYEKVAYEMVVERSQKDRSEKNSHTGSKGADAGYAAILSYGLQLDELKIELKEDDARIKAVQQDAVDSMLRFAAYYHQDERSTSVLTRAAETLFSLDQYDEALKVSSALIDGNKTLDKSLRKTALGIIAHSSFKMKNYTGAADQYTLQRELVAVDSDEYQQITDRLAAAIYKQSERMIKAGDKLKAVAHLLSLKIVASKSATRVTAQFDAATLLLELKQWTQAISELKELENNFSQNALAIEFPRKLAFAYENNEDWGNAARYYLSLYQKDSDPAIRQDALFLAAGLYEKNGQHDEAINQYKRYANEYELPFDNRMEARYQLALIYKTKNDQLRHLYWLRRIIDGDKRGEALRTERSRWLGAWANIQYGDYFAWEFERKKLGLPLEKSLPRKNKALLDATTRYQMAADYRILEFVTMASYKIADLYEQFAENLLHSPMPRDLRSADKKVYTKLIEEQANPFMNLAIEIHQSNIERGWGGDFNQWIDQSFIAMTRLSPARFSKTEVEVNYGDEIL